jgi:hypothetical protein
MLRQNNTDAVPEAASIDRFPSLSLWAKSTFTSRLPIAIITAMSDVYL